MKYLLSILALILGIYLGINHEYISNEEFTTEEVVQAKLDKINWYRTWRAYSDEEKIITQVFGKDSEIAIAISKAESKLNCKARGDSGDSIGLFQIHMPSHKKYTKEELLNCRRNVEIAYQIYKSSGWYAWSTFKDNKYLKYL